MKIIVSLLISLIIYIGTLLIFYKGIREIFFKNSTRKRKITWLLIDIFISALIFIFIAIYYFQIRNHPNYISFTKIFYSVTFFFLTFIPKLAFAIVQVIRFTISVFLRIFKVKLRKKRPPYIALIHCIIIFFIILWGIAYGKTNFKVREANICSPSLPESFNNLKIVQVSDIHIGSFCNNKSYMLQVVNIINDLKPDIVFFTGDLVNNFADEANGYDSIFQKIKAPLGKYAVLGNHDFGDYTVWRTPETKNTNLNEIIFHYNAMGFKLLRNTNCYIVKGNDSIAIAGVDSWGLPPFKQYGDVMKAIDGIPQNTYTILLSHDPSYWNSVIKYIKKISVTFSGHTHGMQLGLENIGIEWSPIKYRYPQWGGLYCDGEQYLYVNRGLGFIGFTGRIGMSPEITLLEIKKK